MKSCNDGRNISNDAGDDACDVLLATATFLLCSDQRSSGADGGLTRCN